MAATEPIESKQPSGTVKNNGLSFRRQYYIVCTKTDYKLCQYPNIDQINQNIFDTLSINCGIAYDCAFNDGIDYNYLYRFVII